MFGQSHFKSCNNPKIIRKIYVLAPRATTRSPEWVHSNSSPLIAPKFGGKLVYLYVKGDKRIWVSGKQAFIAPGTFPGSFLEGVILQAELVRYEKSWIVAFEDVLMAKGIHVTSVPFEDRFALLVELITQLARHADFASDPGAYAVKPWLSKDDLEKYDFKKPPTLHVVRTGKNDLAIVKGLVTESLKVFHISKDGDEEDQYLLTDDKGEEVGKACVRGLYTSLWLRTLENGTRVRCKFIAEHDRYEPVGLFS